MMTNDYYVNKDSTSEHFEELKSIINTREDQPTDAISLDKSIHMKEDIYNTNSNYHESLLSSNMISIDSTPENLLMDNIIPSRENSHDIYFNPQELLINDPNFGKPRPPRQNEFLYLLLENSHYSSYISWLNKNLGLFKIHEPERVATLWKQVKNRHTNGPMDYDTFARGIRYYYKSGLMIKTYKKYTFRFNMPVIINRN